MKVKNIATKKKKLEINFNRKWSCRLKELNSGALQVLHRWTNSCVYCRCFFFFVRGTQVKAQARGPLPKAVKLLVAGVTMMDQVFVPYATGQFIWDRASISASVLRWNVGSHFSEVWQAPRLRSPSYHMGAQQGHNISFRQEGKLSNHQVHPWQQSDESIATQCTERQKGTGWLTKSALLNYVFWQSGGQSKEQFFNSSSKEEENMS